MLLFNQPQLLERELAVVIQNFSEIEVSLRNAQLQLNSVTKIKEENLALKNCVKSITEKIYALIEINDKQDRLIDLLQQPQNEVPISHDCRLFGNRSDYALSSVNDEEKQNITTDSIAPGLGSSYRDTAITV